MAADAVRLGRDEARFEGLYREYAGDVYRYALAIMRNPSDAEDVTQTTFLNAWRAYCAGEEPRTPLNWFIAIAHNVCRLRFRTNSRRPREVEFEPALAESPTTETPDTSEVLDALAELPLNQRAALVMRELEGRSYVEIADVLGVSRSAVETLIFRARRSLRVRREAIGTLAVLPLPSSLATFFRTPAAQTGAAAVGAGVAAKAVAVIAAGLVAAGAARETVLADTNAAPSRQASAAVDRQSIAPATSTRSIAARETFRVAAAGRFAARPSAPVQASVARPAPRPVASPRREEAPTTAPAAPVLPQAAATPAAAPKPKPRAADPPLRRIVPSIPVALPELPELPELPAPPLPPVSPPSVPAPPLPEVPVATPELPAAPEIPAVEVPLPSLP